MINRRPRDRSRTSVAAGPAPSSSVPRGDLRWRLAHAPRIRAAFRRRPRLPKRISARKGVVVVRSGNGDAYREVEPNALVRGMLDE
jgi:FtsP/CotA-like multicopper oxidase with cupredoxin domain